MLDRHAIEREQQARLEQRLCDIRALVSDAETGRRPLRACLSLIADIALGESDRTVRVGAPHTPEVTT